MMRSQLYAARSRRRMHRGLGCWDISLAILGVILTGILLGVYTNG